MIDISSKGQEVYEIFFLGRANAQLTWLLRGKSVFIKKNNNNNKNPSLCLKKRAKFHEQVMLIQEGFSEMDVRL